MSDDKTLETLEAKVSQVITDVAEKVLPEMVAKQIGEKVETSVQDKVKDLGLDKIDLKHGNFPGFKHDDKSTAAERSALFIKSVYKNDVATIQKEFMSKGMLEDVDSQGGFTVPTPLASEILRIMENVGVVRKLSRVWPMTSKSLEIPKKATKANVTWEGEAQEGTDGSPKLAMIELQAKRARGLVPFSEELLADSSADLVQFVTALIGEALAEAEDFQGLRGVGTPFTGILNEVGVVNNAADAGNTTVATLTLPDWRKAITPIPSAELNGSVWVMHPTVWEAVQTIQEGGQTVVAFSQNNITSPEVTADVLVPVGRLWSRMVYLSDQMPDVTEIDAQAGNQVAILGNFRNFAFGNRQGMTMAMSSEASMVIGGQRINAFTSDQRIMKVGQRVALKVAQEEGFSILTTAAA